MPQVTTLIDKFLRRDTLTTQDKADLRSDIGAAGTALEITTALQDVALDPLQPTKISKDYMPEQIESQIQLGDTSGVALPVGQLGGDGTANVYIHDGSTTGGIRLMRDVPMPSQNSCLFTHTLATPSSAAKFVKLGEIVVPAAYAVNSGGINLNLEVACMPSDATINLSEFGVALRMAGQAADESLIFSAPSAAAATGLVHDWSIFEYFIFAEGDNLALYNSGKYRVTRYPSVSGNVTGMTGSASVLGAEFAPAGQDMTLEIGIYIATLNPALAGHLDAKARWAYQLVAAQ